MQTNLSLYLLKKKIPNLISTTKSKSQNYNFLVEQLNNVNLYFFALIQNLHFMNSKIYQL